MATRKQIGYGARGDEVKELQNTLNSKGYSLSADGIFGDKTLAAVKDYQQKNNLAVDGIVGNNTWGSLFAASAPAATPTTPTTTTTTPTAATTPTTTTTTTTPTTTTPTKTDVPQLSTDQSKTYSDKDLSKYNDGYQKSDAVLDAEKKAADADAAVANKGNFQYSGQDQYEAIYDQIMNREKFSYDINGDALYQQYKDQYIKLGQMAMMDTMGQAAAMTGGYGSSYGQAVGQQAYNAQLENLNDIVPELYQMALDRYQMEGQDLYQKYGMLADDKSMEYGMWGDEYDRLLADRDYYTGRADTEQAIDYGQYMDNKTYDTEQYWKETAFGYQKDQDAIANQKWMYEAERIDDQFEKELLLKKDQLAEQVRHNLITEEQAADQLKLAEKELSDRADEAKAELEYKYAELPYKYADYDDGGDSDGGGDGGGGNDTTTEDVGGHGQYAYSPELYKTWGNNEWTEYFRAIRESKGEAEAKEWMTELIQKGLLPKGYAQAAFIGISGKASGNQ